MYVQMKLRHYDCVTRLRDAVQEYVSQRRAMLRSARRRGRRSGNRQNQRRRYQRLIAARAGRLIANRKQQRSRSRIREYRGGNDDYWNEIRLVRSQHCWLCCTPGSSLSPGPNCTASPGTSGYGPASACMTLAIFRSPTWTDARGRRTWNSAQELWACFSVKSWAGFTAAHSRYWAKRNGRQFSRLCVADKLAFVLTPAWLYLPMTRATGELSEYMLRAKERQAGSEHFTDYESARLNSSDAREWLEGLKSYTQRWVDEHRNGGADNWTVGACAESKTGFR